MNAKEKKFHIDWINRALQTPSIKKLELPKKIFDLLLSDYPDSQHSHYYQNGLEMLGKKVTLIKL